MKATELLLIGLVGWTGIGLVGVAVAWRRRELEGELDKVRRGIWWLVSVWIVYLGVLLTVSLTQRQRVLSIGEPQCFDEMCFTVVKVEEVPGFLIRDGRRLVRVSIRVTNGARKPESEGLIRAYLVDSQDRQWEESLGVNGVGLRVRVAGGDSVICEPVFKVAGNATGLKLVLTHGRWRSGALVIGNSESLLHRRTVVELGR